MKKFFIFSIIVLFVSGTSCNNSGNEKKNDEKTKTPAEKLMDEVDEAHMEGMSKMGKLSRLESQVAHFLDSLSKLPEKDKKASADLKVSIESLQNDLRSAQDGMDKWMNEFKYDSAENNNALRVKYLESEKIKVAKVRVDMLNAIQKADSLLNKPAMK